MSTEQIIGLVGGIIGALIGLFGAVIGVIGAAVGIYFGIKGSRQAQTR